MLRLSDALLPEAPPQTVQLPPNKRTYGRGWFSYGLPGIFLILLFGGAR